MKNLFTLMLMLLSQSALATFAEPSKLIGTWTGPCNDLGGRSYRAQSIFQEDGKLISVNLNYQNDSSCSTSPSVTKSEGAYQIISEDPERAVIAAQADRPDGSRLEVQSEIKFLNGQTAQMKALSVKMIQNGAVTEVPAEQITKMPVVLITRE